MANGGEILGALVDRPDRKYQPKSSANQQFALWNARTHRLVHLAVISLALLNQRSSCARNAHHGCWIFPDPYERQHLMIIWNSIEIWLLYKSTAFNPVTLNQGNRRGS